VEDLAELAKKAVAHTEQGKAPPQPLAEEIRVLVVDDDRDFVNSITPALDRRGISVTKAHDSATAIREAASRQHEVAVVDIILPNTDGLVLMERLQEMDPLLEVIILTGYPRSYDARRGFKQGAFDFLAKPQSIDDLVLSIRGAYERREQRRSSARNAVVDEILERHPD
jgi:DNA-binding NtrC family response regulator